MKKIMVIGTTRTQVPLIKTAQRMGYYVIAAGTNGDYPGIKVADEACFVDITSPQKVLEQAQKLKIDGIATCCMDMGVRAVGYVCENMGLCGLTENSALLSNEKLSMKMAFEKHGVNSPKFVKIEKRDDLKTAWESLRHPVILKAVDLQASRGIFKCNSSQELEHAYDEVIHLTRENFCIVEEFIEGIDIGAQAMVYQGEILFILPHNDEVYTGSANKPIGHSAPLLASENVLHKTKRQCELAIQALGLNNCAVNIDLIKTENDEVYMIELTGRAGATCLPELVSLYYGIDYYEMIVAMAMGEDPRLIFSKRSSVFTPNASRFIMADKTGCVREVINRNSEADDIALLELYVKAGDMVRKFEDGKDAIGEVIVTGKDIPSCISRLDEISANIDVIY